MRVVMAILDGLPSRHTGPDVTPVLARLAESGATAVGRSVMTSATYPNHATFVTGVAPVEHGLLANWVHDGERPRPAHHVGPQVPTLFDACAEQGRASAAVVGDHRLVGVMGARRATWHWPPQGRIPQGTERDRYDYSADRAVVERCREVWAQDWHLAVVHLNEPDTAGHIDGPDSAAAARAYGETDRAFGAIVDDLEAFWDDLVLIVLSDHDQREVDRTAPLIPLDPPGTLTAIPEGSGAVVWGVDPDRGRWLADVDGVAGHEEVTDTATIVWATPGRLFALPAGLGHDELRGHHGGAETRDQVVVVAGGHRCASELAAAVGGTTPPAEGWAPTIADLLALEPFAGRSLLA